MGLLEKSDKIDTGAIAWYAEVKRSKPVVLSSPTQQHLRALVTRLRQLTQLHTAQRNQQRLITDSTVQGCFDELLALSSDRSPIWSVPSPPCWPRIRCGGN